MASEKEVRNFTGSRLNRLIQNQAEGQQKADLARLRRGIGQAPGDDPLLWGTFLSDMPEDMYGKNGEPSRAEWAVYTALTLFALHQQGKDCKKECMYQSGIGFGNAMAGLIDDPNEDEDRVIRRFNMVATSSDMIEMAYHLRGVVQLLRARSIPLDYVDLAGDLYRFQNEDQKEQIRLKWGQDFYSRKNRSENERGEEETNE